MRPKPGASNRNAPRPACMCSQSSPSIAASQPRKVLLLLSLRRPHPRSVALPAVGSDDSTRMSPRAVPAQAPQKSAICAPRSTRSDRAHGKILGGITASSAPVAFANTSNRPTIRVGDGARQCPHMRARRRFGEQKLRGSFPDGSRFHLTHEPAPSVIDDVDSSPPRLRTWQDEPFSPIRSIATSVAPGWQREFAHIPPPPSHAPDRRSVHCKTALRMPSPRQSDAQGDDGPPSIRREVSVSFTLSFVEAMPGCDKSESAKRSSP